MENCDKLIKDFFNFFKPTIHITITITKSKFKYQWYWLLQ
jgi:hypothetical protein